MFTLMGHDDDDDDDDDDGWHNLFFSDVKGGDHSSPHIIVFLRFLDLTTCWIDRLQRVISCTVITRMISICIVYIQLKYM